MKERPVENLRIVEIKAVTCADGNQDLKRNAVPGPNRIYQTSRQDRRRLSASTCAVEIVSDDDVIPATRQA